MAIGINVRSVRHLYRLSDTSFKTALIRFRENKWGMCKVLRAEGNRMLYIFNQYIMWGDDSFSTVKSRLPKSQHGELSEICSRYNRLISFENVAQMAAVGAEYIRDIVLLPDSFTSDYNKFVTENAKMLSAIMEYDVRPDDVRLPMLYCMTDGSKNFFQWAARLMFKNCITFCTIKSILLWNESYKQYTKKLSKGTITAYTNEKQLTALMGEMSEIRKEKRINDSINSFNTAQKKMLKEAELSEQDKQSLWKLSRLSDTKRVNFIKKMSSVDCASELLRQLRFITGVHFEWNKESVMDFLKNIEGMDYKMVFENDTTVVVKALNYETIKQLGKTTNWCISKNKQYWNQYIECHHGSASQYVVLDFSKKEDDKLSIIGFTTMGKKGITSAHNFTNDNLMEERSDRINMRLLNSYISQFGVNKNIYNVLDDLGFDITLIMKYAPLPYEWNRDAFMEYLYKHVRRDSVDVLKSDGDKLVLSVKDKNIDKFFGNGYLENISNSDRFMQHIIFADFSKSKFDFSKLLFGIINDNGNHEEYCDRVYNESVCVNQRKSFDTLLSEFGLPYNTIRRPNNVVIRLIQALVDADNAVMTECGSKCTKEEIESAIEAHLEKDSVFDVLLRSITSRMSFDYLDLFYGKGMHITPIISEDYMSDIIKQVFNSMVGRARNTTRFTHFEGVADNDVQMFYKRKLDTVNDAMYIGCYAALKMMLEFETESLGKEDSMTIVGGMIASASRMHESLPVFEQLFDIVKDKVSYDINIDLTRMLVRYAYKHGTREFAEFLNKKSAESKTLKAVIEEYLAETNAKKVEFKPSFIDYVPSFT